VNPLERRIEAALDAWFEGEGWRLEVRRATGDHVATSWYETDEGEDSGPTVNLTECARRVAEEVGR